MHSVRIVPLERKHLDRLSILLVETWPAYYGPGGEGSAVADLTTRCAADSLPVGLGACAPDPLGTVALSPTSFGAEPGETPWVTGLCVASSARRSGIGTALVEAVQSDARLRGYQEIWATTRAAAGVLARLGWQAVRDVPGGLQVWSLRL